MNLIIGLGNPGARYNFTRHNFGFLALDFYFKKTNLAWNEKPKFGAIYQKTQNAIFIKPQDFYNLTGDVVQKFANYYKIPPENILVVCDDFDLDFGQLRFRTHGSAGGNNGLKSIISKLGTDQFPRLRLGTNNPDLRKTLGDINFVLSKFTPEEKSTLPTILNSVEQKINDFLSN